MKKTSDRLFALRGAKARKEEVQVSKREHAAQKNFGSKALNQQVSHRGDGSLVGL